MIVFMSVFLLSLKLVNMKLSVFFIIRNFGNISGGVTIRIICIEPLFFTITIVYISNFLHLFANF